MTTPLARRLGTADAVWIGVGSMVGAGVFAVWPAAARAAGPGLLIGLAIAAVVAFANATSSAQLAAQYPASGGTYLYGRERLGPWWGFLAGWSFCVGKTASCAAMALTFAAYAAPDLGQDGQRALAAAAVIAMSAVNYRGITRTAGLTRLLVTIVVVLLAVALVAAWTGDASPADGIGSLPSGPYGALQAAGLLFFAFAGYARIATLGEEVRDPARTIPRAIVAALAFVVLLYAAVAVTLLATLGSVRVATSRLPLVDAVEAGAWPGVGPAVQVAAAVASLGALLALIAGVGRTALAMAREGDLPRWLDAVHPRFQVPHRAEIAVAVLVTVLIVTTDLRGVIGFSSFGVLIYYFVANLAAWTQSPPHRRYPRGWQVVGATGCAMLAVSLPGPSVVGGVAMIALGVGYRSLSRQAS